MGIQIIKRRTRFNRLKHLIGSVVKEIDELSQVFFLDTPIIKGSIYELKRRCGKRNCKCAKGEQHVSMVISMSEGGKTKLHTISLDQVEKLKPKVEHYKQQRQSRAQLVKLFDKMIRAIDEIEEMRREEIQ